MCSEEQPGSHNPVLHELNLAGWLVSRCVRHAEYWSSTEARGHLLRGCGETVECVGELADQLTDHDPDVAAAVRRLATLLAGHGRHLENATG